MEVSKHELGQILSKRKIEFDEFWPEQNVPRHILPFVPIGTFSSFVQLSFFTHFGLFLGFFFFLIWKLYLDVFWTCIPNKIHLKLIIKSLNNYFRVNYPKKINYHSNFNIISLFPLFPCNQSSFNKIKYQSQKFI